MAVTLMRGCLGKVMIVHFIYTVPALSPASRLRRKAMRIAHGYGMRGGWVGQRANLSTKGWPSYSPVSITQHVYEALRSQHVTMLYDYQERKVIRGGPDHILIGHPDPTDPLAVWNESFEKGEFAARIAMLPLHHARAEINAPLDRYLPLCDGVLGIMGTYWYDTWEQSPFEHWKHKLTRLDMAIDTWQFQRVKTRFNPPGKRKFLYIGNDNPCKGVHLLSLLFGLAKDQRCVWMGGTKELANVECRPGFAALDRDLMTRVAEECDFFITMGVSDANPTTILESMAWGFPVCCTPQSGYYGMPEIEELSTTDMNHNIAVLDRLQEAPETELLERADAARRLVETKYTWNRFTATVLTKLKSIAVQKRLICEDKSLTRGVDAYSEIVS